MDRRSFVLAAAVLPVWAAAQAAWPSHPLRLLVPGDPGGVADIRARWIAQRLSARFGQPVVVENRPGAGGNIATEAGARSAPDGYTLTIIHQGTMTVNPHLYARTGYDPIADFAPVARLGIGPLLMAVHPSVAANTVTELVQLARAKPGTLAFGSPGVGTPPHLAAELFRQQAGIDVLHVPYRGGGQSLAGLLGGQVQFAIEGPSVLGPQVTAGKLRALAMTGPQRMAALPTVPTMIEAGWPQATFQGWVGLAAPAATPPAVLRRLAEEASTILATQEAKDWFASIGSDPGEIAPAEFAREIRAEYAKWGKVIQAAGLRLE